MNRLSNDILLNIYEFSDNKNLIYACKRFESYLKNLKNSFIDYLDDNELSISYQLAKIDRKIIDFKYSRYIESETYESFQKMVINRENFNQDCAKITNNKIVFKRYFLENLLPTSTLYCDDSRDSLYSNVTYYRVNLIKVNNIELFKKYLVLK